MLNPRKPPLPAPPTMIRVVMPLSAEGFAAEYADRVHHLARIRLPIRLPQHWQTSAASHALVHPPFEPLSMR